MIGPIARETTPRFSTSQLSPDVDPAEKEFVKLLERALAPSFSLVRRLGSGGMGAVYLARDPVLKRLVAVKLLSPTLAANPEARARFHREAQAVASITHPSVVAVYSVGELENGVPYFVMQYVEGRSVAERLLKDGHFEVRAAKRVLAEVASALAAAHRKGIIHRDIKPANILIDDETGRALVTDFGIAAVLERGDEREATRITHTGMAVGTPAFMSPEQLLAEPVTEKTDIYSLGLLAYELLIGESPYRINSPREVMAAHLRDTPRQLSAIRGDVEPELERLIASCLTKDPARRPSAAEVEGRLMHGASILLEWPPPGLEPMQAKFYGALSAFAVGSIALAIPVIVQSVFDRSTGIRELLPRQEFIMPFAVIGFFAFLIGCLRLERLMRSAGRASGGGYRWGTILESLADQRGDTGALIAGAREYATLEPPERSRFRLLRVARAMLLLGAAALPLLGFTIGLLVAARFESGPSIVLWSSLMAGLIMLGASASITVYENWRLQSARARRNPLATVHERPAELAGQWTATFDQVRVGQPLGAGPRARRREAAVITSSVVALVGLAALGATLLLLFSTVMTTLGEVAIPTYEFLHERVHRVERLSSYVVPVDSSLSPLRAGQALHSISRSGGVAASQWEAEPSIAIAARPRRAGPVPFADKSSQGLVEAFRLARRGFTDEQRQYLERLAENPALAEFRLVASAPTMDYGAAMWNVPPGSRLTHAELPVLRYAPISAAGSSNIARAALELSAGRPADVERRLREVISVGFLLMRHGQSTMSNFVGANIVNSARGSLEAFYQQAGRLEEARFVSPTSDPVHTRMTEGTRRRASIQEIMASARARILDGAELRGVRWEQLIGYYQYQACSDPKQMLFGVDEDFRRTLDEARASLVRNASDSLLFALAEQPLDAPTMMRDGAPRVGGTGNWFARTARAITGHRAIETCLALAGFN